MVITNGFTYIAFLMFIAGGLLFLEKKTKWKVFGVVPPLVWIYVLNMIFWASAVFLSEPLWMAVPQVLPSWLTKIS